MIIKLDTLRALTWSLRLFLTVVTLQVLPCSPKLAADEASRTNSIENETEQPESYRLRPYDYLEIYIETITDFIPEHLYPVYEPSEDINFPPGTGYVFPVGENGKIALPNMLHPHTVEGMTLEETHSLIRRAYVDVTKIFQVFINWCESFSWRVIFV